MGGLLVGLRRWLSRKFPQLLESFGEFLSDGFVGDAGHFTDGGESVGFMALEAVAEVEEALFLRGELVQVVVEFRGGVVWG
ncbi:MAG: hypothetical protein RI897_4029 [Verrucomicrobiota bacterium]